MTEPNTPGMARLFDLHEAREKRDAARRRRRYLALLAMLEAEVAVKLP